MRAFPFFVFAFFLSLMLHAQRHEIGIGVGATNYAGELAPTYQLENHRLGAEIFYRYNVSNAVSLRGNLMAGQLVGEDDEKFDAFSQRRNLAFDIYFVEAAALFEYNFLDFKRASSRKKPSKSEQRFSPFFFAGVGMFWRGSDNVTREIPDYSKFQPVIPFGIGIKHRLTPYLMLGAEAGARKTFFDYIDNVGDMLPAENDNIAKNYQYGNPQQKDWYFFSGITLTYTIWSLKCPFDYYGAGPYDKE